MPRQLEHIVMRCLNHDPAERYPTAHDLARELRGFLSSRFVRKHPEEIRDLFEGPLAERKLRKQALIAAVIQGAPIPSGPAPLAWSLNEATGEHADGGRATLQVAVPPVQTPVPFPAADPALVLQEALRRKDDRRAIAAYRLLRSLGEPNLEPEQWLEVAAALERAGYLNVAGEALFRFIRRYPEHLLRVNAERWLSRAHRVTSPPHSSSRPLGSRS